MDLLGLAPNGTLFLISDDYDSTGYEKANSYIKNFTNNDIITPEAPMLTKIPKFILPHPILNMSFDNTSSTVVPDYSPFGNNGVNNGAFEVEGYYNKALKFNGNAYLSIPENQTFNITDSITISFLLLMENYDQEKGYMVLSKGYGPRTGSYDILIWDNQIWFELGGLGGLTIPINPYLGAWHHFIFTYNGEKMETFVDGSLVASKIARGTIRTSSFNLEIGRDNERIGAYFEGVLDEFQVSDEPLNAIQLGQAYFDHYAVKIGKISPTNSSNAVFFRLVGNPEKKDEQVLVRNSHIELNLNGTETLKIEVESTKSKEITILLSTDQSLKVIKTHLNNGINDVNLKYPYISDLKVVIIDGNQLVYTGFIPMINLDYLRFILIIVMFFVLIAYTIACLFSTVTPKKIAKQTSIA